jgi:hypothetical protein
VKRWLFAAGLLIAACPAFAQFPSVYNNPESVTASPYHSWLRDGSFIKQCSDSANWIPSRGDSGDYVTYPNELHNDLVCQMAFLDGLGRQQALQNQLLCTVIVGLGLLLIPAYVGVFKGAK